MAQRKLTEPGQDSSADLPDLTAQQMKFVEGLLRGLSASDAYRGAYDTDNSQASTIWANASRLANDSKVAAWVSAAKKGGLEKLILSKEEWLRLVLSASEEAKIDGNHGARMDGLKTVGKALGHLVEQHQDLTKHEVAVTLEEVSQVLLSLPAEIRADLAKMLTAEQPRALASTPTAH